MLSGPLVGSLFSRRLLTYRSDEVAEKSFSANYS